MSRAAKFRRLGLLLLLANALLVCAAALIRHADADESGQPVSDVPGAAASAPPPLDAPAPSSEPSPVGPLPQTDDAILAPPMPSDDSSSSRLTNDPVLEEMRKLVRNPDSGLDVPPIHIPFLKTPPATDPTQSTPAGSADQWPRLMQRTESLHHLATAAYTLSREAQALAEAGQTDEAMQIKRHVAQLQAMLAHLAAPQ